MLWGVKVHYSPVYWDNNESLEQKLNRLLKQVDELSQSGKTLSLVGVSAGASMAMDIYALRKNKIHKAVFICGKLLYPETIGERYFQKHPAFRKSVFTADSNIKNLASADKARMLSLYALADNTVPVRASKLPGVQSKRILALGHIPAIYAAIIFYSPPIAKFIKS